MRSSLLLQHLIFRPIWRQSTHSLRRLSGLSLRPTSITIQEQPTVRLRIQRKKIFTWKRLRWTGIILFGFWLLGPTIAIVEVVEVEETEDESQNQDQSSQSSQLNNHIHSNSETREVDVFTIPLTLPKLSQGYRYSMDDPEWQRYIEFNSDKQLQKQVQYFIAHLVRERIGQTTIENRIGKVDPTIGGIWLEFDFPLGPPRDYEYFGIEVIPEEGVIAIGIQTMKAKDYRIIRALVSPITFYNSFKTAFKIFSKQWSIKSNTNAKEPETSNSQITDNSTASTSTRTSTSNSTTTTSNPTSPHSSTISKPLSEDGDMSTKSLLYVLSTVKLFVQIFRATFTKELGTGQFNDPIDPLRGNARVHGLIQVVGSKGSATVDVRLEYNIQDKCVERLQAYPRSLTDFSSRPRKQN